MVVQLKTYGLEARFWIVSTSPTIQVIVWRSKRNFQPVVTASGAAARCAIQVNEEEVRHVAKRA